MDGLPFLQKPFTCLAGVVEFRRRSTGTELRAEAEEAGCCRVEPRTKFLRLFREAAIGDRIDGWRVC